jgi:hypothetical protein
VWWWAGWPPWCATARRCLAADTMLTRAHSHCCRCALPPPFAALAGCCAVRPRPRSAQAPAARAPARPTSACSLARLPAARLSAAAAK